MTRPLRPGFWSDQRGSATIDAVVVFLPLLLTIFAIFEIGLAYYVTLSAQKAAQSGARFAALRDPVRTDLPERNLLAYSAGNIGDACFQPGSNADACRDPGGPFVCDGRALDPACDPTRFAALIEEMRRLYPSLDPETVEISYVYRRLGYAEGPFQPEVVVEIENRPMPFALITRFGLIRLRTVVASAFGEDLRTSA